MTDLVRTHGISINDKKKIIESYISVLTTLKKKQEDHAKTFVATKDKRYLALKKDFFELGIDFFKNLTDIIEKPAPMSAPSPSRSPVLIPQPNYSLLPYGVQGNSQPVMGIPFPQQLAINHHPSSKSNYTAPPPSQQITQVKKRQISADVIDKIAVAKILLNFSNKEKRHKVGGGAKKKKPSTKAVTKVLKNLSLQKVHKKKSK